MSLTKPIVVKPGLHRHIGISYFETLSYHAIGLYKSNHNCTGYDSPRLCCAMVSLFDIKNNGKNVADVRPDAPCMWRFLCYCDHRFYSNRQKCGSMLMTGDTILRYNIVSQKMVPILRGMECVKQIIRI